MQLPHDNKKYFKPYLSPIYQQVQPLWAWTKAYTPDGKTFYPFAYPGTCKDYIIDSFIGRRNLYDTSILNTEKAQQQNCVLILCDATKKKQLQDNLNIFNEFCAKHGAKPTSVIDIEIPENKYIHAYVVMGDSIWSKNAFVYSIYLSMIRILHTKQLTDTYFNEQILRESDERDYIIRWGFIPKYLNLIVNAFQNLSQYLEDLPDKYDVRGATVHLEHSHGQYGPFHILTSLHYLNTSEIVHNKNHYLHLIKEGYFYEKFQNELCPVVAKPAPKKRPMP